MWCEKVIDATWIDIQKWYVYIMFKQMNLIKIMLEYDVDEYNTFLKF